MDPSNQQSHKQEVTQSIPQQELNKEVSTEINQNIQKPPRSGLAIASLILGIVSFVPLIGVLLGIIAIILGIISLIKIKSFKQKGKGMAISGIVLGTLGIIFTIVLYGSLFYFGFVAKTGPYADLKKQLTVQELNQLEGSVLIYKNKYRKLPNTLNDLGKPTPQNPIFIDDPWGNAIIYKVNADGTFLLKSDGPDGIPNTSDDISPSQ